MSARPTGRWEAGDREPGPEAEGARGTHGAERAAGTRAAEGARPTPVAMLAVAVLTLATLALAACERRDAAASWQGTVDTLASGTVVVHNPRQGIWGEEAGWRLVEELRIGDIAMEEPEIFAGVNGLLVDGEGRIFILDRSSHRVQLFGADGSFVRSIGREGQGPGELQDPIGLAWAGPGRIVVADARNARYSVFDTSGTYVEGRPRQLTGYSVPWQGSVDAEGRLTEVTSVGGSRSVVRTDPAFVPIDTVPLPAFEWETFVLRTESATMAAGVPYSSSQIGALGPDGNLWVGTTGDYRIARLGWDGDTALVVEKEAERLPVTAEDREGVEERLEWFTRQGGRLDLSRIPREKPYFSQFHVSEDGHVWVERTPEPGADSTRLDVFDPEGRYLGAVRLPFAPFYPVIEGDRMVATTTDSLGVPYVVRMRIERGEP